MSDNEIKAGDSIDQVIEKGGRIDFSGKIISSGGTYIDTHRGTLVNNNGKATCSTDTNKS